MPLPEIDQQQEQERDGEHQRGDGGSGGQVKLLQALEDKQRHHFADVGLVASDEDDRTELAQAARERQHHAGGERGHQLRQDDAGKNLRRTRAEGRRRFFHRRRQRFQHRLHRTHDERDAGEYHGDDDARRFVGDGDAERRQRFPQPAFGGKEGGKGNAGDGGRQGEGQIDQGVDEDAAGEAVAGQHPGEQQAKKRVKQ